MGWIFVVALFIGFVINDNPLWLIAAGLFAICGGLEEVANAIGKLMVEDDKEE